LGDARRAEDGTFSLPSPVSLPLPAAADCSSWWPSGGLAPRGLRWAWPPAVPDRPAAPDGGGWRGGGAVVVSGGPAWRDPLRLAIGAGDFLGGGETRAVRWPRGWRRGTPCGGRLAEWSDPGTSAAPAGSCAARPFCHVAGRCGRIPPPTDSGKVPWRSG